MIILLLITWERLNKYFSVYLLPLLPTLYISPLNLSTFAEGFKQLLSNIVPHESSGPDQIPDRLFKLQ